MATESPIIKELDIEKIICDVNLQIRVKIDRKTSNNYADTLERGTELPPLVVYQEGEGEAARFLLVDGWHRLAAYQQLQRQYVRVEVRQGSYRDALLYALGANETHGLPRSNADKRKAVDIFLLNENLQDWSNEDIAKHVGVTSHTVGNRRKYLENKGLISKSTERKFTRNNKISTMKTDNLSGRKKRLRPTKETPAPPVPREEPNESEHRAIPLVSTAPPLKVEESAIASESPDDLQHETQHVCTHESDTTGKPVPEAEQQEHTDPVDLVPDDLDSRVLMLSLRGFVFGLAHNVKDYRLKQAELSPVGQEIVEVLEKAVSKAEELLKSYPSTPPYISSVETRRMLQGA